MEHVAGGPSKRRRIMIVPHRIYRCGVMSVAALLATLLIVQLLASEGYGKRLADLWQDILLTRTSENRRMQPAPFVKWLADNFNANKPWNRLAHDLLTATGTQESNPAVTWFLANESVDKI